MQYWWKRIHLPFLLFAICDPSSSAMPPSSSRAAARAKTLRKSSSSLSARDHANAGEVMISRTNSIASRAQAGDPFTDEELDDVINSLQNITPHGSTIDWDALRRLLGDVAHLSHKEWHVTSANSDKMAKILTPDGITAETSQIFERILHEGNWDGALEHAKEVHDHGDPKRHKQSAWAVLVTGVNGIRKTTAMYQPWFAKALQEALVPPAGVTVDLDVDSLPTGKNSFFRQLDHMIVTLCNEHFSTLYALTGAQLPDNKETNPSKELIQKYSNLKASIFSRYRTLSELLGVLLLKAAQECAINVMCETSGRDVAMFHYLDHFFGKRYNKLAIHFRINDLTHAMQSVDQRMVTEMKTGRDALSGDVVDVIYSNAGGPYGSEVLAGVQNDSSRVWDEVVSNDVVGKDWFKATFEIEAHGTKPWTIRALRPDGSYGTKFEFGEARKVC